MRLHIITSDEMKFRSNAGESRLKEISNQIEFFKFPCRSTHLERPRHHRPDARASAVALLWRNAALGLGDISSACYWTPTFHLRALSACLTISISCVSCFPVRLLCSTTRTHCGDEHPLECAEAAMQSLATIIANIMATYFFYLIFYHLVLERTLRP